VADPPGDLEVRRTSRGAELVVDGAVRATFVGDLDDPRDRAAFEEMAAELFPGRRRADPTE
jgi:hypothetical protein